MISLRPSLGKLHVIAGEGNFHLYRLLKSGKRVFVFTKLMLTTLSYFRGRGEFAKAQTVAFVKGSNQLRHHQHVIDQLTNELGTIQLFASSHRDAFKDCRSLPRITCSDVLLQSLFLVLMLIVGKRRYLNLYFLAFEAAIAKAVNVGMQSVKIFVCYNDQPYDVAAILYSLHARGSCRTIVIQHGLVVSEQFYYPTVATEFWAWGELSRRHYRAWHKTSQFLIKGRYHDDIQKKLDHFVPPTSGSKVRILIAPSFFHDEVKLLLSKLDDALKGEFACNVSVAIKFHPATKFVSLLQALSLRKAPWLVVETDPMESLADKYDLLITKNSTSAVDFLLLGKLVFFLEPHNNQCFPSNTYGFELHELVTFLWGKTPKLAEKDKSRQQFLRSALNV